jgi:putative hydrolase of the HAD superfamily
LLVTMDIKVIAFDADDTLWVNEPYFRKTEEKFYALLQGFLTTHNLERELLKTEIENLALYGYGVKGFILSMIETALKVSDKNIGPDIIEKIIQMGKELLEEPIELLEDIEAVLSALNRKSGLGHYFHHIEIMSEKGEADYLKLLKHLDIKPEEFLMIGNSLKSDVLPVINIGGHAIHIPYHITWEHEVVDTNFDHVNFKSAKLVNEVLGWL